MNEFVTLGEVLQNINSYRWSDALFLLDEDEWGEDTKGVILDPNNVEDDEEDVPDFAKKNNMVDALGIGTIQEICDNAFQQKKECTIDELINAYLYYYNNDAFITFEG